MTAEADLREEMIRVGRLLYERQLVVAAEGNLSCRLGGDLFLVTPAGACKGLLGAADLLAVDATGRPATGEGRPSSEWPLHREIYALRPDAAAICHGHPPWATAFAAAGQALDGCLLPEIVATLGRIPLAPYGTPGTEEVPRSVRELIPGHDALLLANHGVVAVGGSPLRAYFRLESVERLAQITLLARLAGGESRLTAEQAAAVRALVPDVGAGGGPPACRPAPAADSGPPAVDLEGLAERMAREILADLSRPR